MRDKCVEMGDNANKMRDRLIRLLQKRSCFYNKSKCNARCSNCDYVTIDDDDISNLADHLLANGVVALPVNIGETVYYIFCDSSILELKVASIEIAPIETFRIVFGCYGGVGFYERDIGKTVFFTREEAERALKGAKE